MQRRMLIKGLLLAVSAGSITRRSLGASLARLDPQDPAAAARGYVENAAKVDSKKFPAFVPGSSCENCLLLQGASGERYRPCDLFPGKVVAAGGWCSGWAAEI